VGEDYLMSNGYGAALDRPVLHAATGRAECPEPDQIGGSLRGHDQRLRLLSVTGYRQPLAATGRAHDCRLTTWA
jgi:hypothetical protein